MPARISLAIPGFLNSKKKPKISAMNIHFCIVSTCPFKFCYRIKLKKSSCSKDIQRKKAKISTMYQHKWPNLLILLKNIQSKRTAIFINFFIETEVFFHCQQNSANVVHIFIRYSKKKMEKNKNSVRWIRNGCQCKLAFWIIILKEIQ